MLKPLSTVKKLKDQVVEEKMHVLKQVALEWLGSQWEYYKKIKTAGEGFQLLKAKSHLDQMKATQSALKFTSKSAKKSYRSTYQICVNEISSRTGLRKENFPLLPETADGKEVPSLSSEFDAVIIAWTPIKFFLPAKQIREKGKATQRHSEGLVAKLFFKVAGFYSIADNWDVRKLSFYLRKLNQDSKYQDVVSALEPLKSDLSKFCEVYEPFKFGQASLSKAVSKDDDTFDDAMGVESFESQVQTLYWYHFIFEALELFIFRYFLTLVTATNSVQTIRYLSGIFEPIFEKAIENKNIFLGTFETDRSKKQFLAPYQKFKQERNNDAEVKKIKTAKGVFETYIYNLRLLEKKTINFELKEPPGVESPWADFLRYGILQQEQLPETPDEDATLAEEGSDSSLIEEALFEMEKEIKAIPLEVREYALIQILAMMIKCIQYKRSSRHKVLERFKQRAISDKELAGKRIKEIRRQAEKQVREMGRKVDKLKRMKQEDAAVSYQADIDKFKKNLEIRCENVRQSSIKGLQLQKKRLQILFKQISKENAVNIGLSLNTILKLTEEIDPESDFIKEFTNFTIKNIQQEYAKELEPFYQNIFDIMEPSTQEKIAIIQSLQKSGGDNAVKLSLSEEEQEENKKMLNGLKIQIEKGLPGILAGKLIFTNLSIPVEDLLNLSIDMQSLQMLLRSKVTTPKNAKPTKLPGNVYKALLVLNMFKNPVTKHSLILEGREKETDPQKAINIAQLKKLLE